MRKAADQLYNDYKDNAELTVFTDLDLDPSIGSEMKKTRPAVIVNDDNLGRAGRLPLKVIVPVTD